VRPIAYENNNAVAVSVADCRLMAFNSADDSTRFWIKVHLIKFSFTCSMIIAIFKMVKRHNYRVSGKVRMIQELSVKIIERVFPVIYVALWSQ